MFNVTVLRMKDVIKYFVGIIVTILIVIIVSKVFTKDTKDEQKIIQNIQNSAKSLSENNLLECLNKTIPAISEVNKEYNTAVKEDDINTNDKNILEIMLQTQISSIKGISISEEKAKEQNNIEQSQTDVETANQENSGDSENASNNTNGVQVAQTGLQTQVITQNPIAENYNTEYEKVKIKNQTSYELTQEMLTPDVTIENKNIVLFHTHSCESYTSSDAYQYNPTGNFRTTDLNFSVTRVGTELENQLKQYDFNVIHNTDYHDYPSYNGSYTRSLQTVESILQTTPADIIMDVHRDAVGSRSDYAPIVKIGDTDVAAQIMFVIGTNEGGLWHPNWNTNLKFAVKVQQKAEEMYPGLFKPIMLTPYRYNQHTGKFASIIEVGATGNTLEQCLNSMKYLARVMSEI